MKKRITELLTQLVEQREENKVLKRKIYLVNQKNSDLTTKAIKLYEENSELQSKLLEYEGQDTPNEDSENITYNANEFLKVGHCNYYQSN